MNIHFKSKIELNNLHTFLPIQSHNPYEYSVCMHVHYNKTCGCSMHFFYHCTDLLKHTPEVHPDHKSLMEIVEVIKSTLV